MNEQLQAFKQGERFCYDTINVPYLRSRMTLPEWLKKYKRTRGIVRSYSPSYGDHSAPPGHPKVFLDQPRTWTTDLDVKIIADPANYAWAGIEYKKETGYRPETHESWAKDNQYYVVYPADYKKLWIPLSWSDMRMRAWEVEVYMNYGKSYLDHRGEQFCYPLSSFWKKVREPKIDPHWKDEYIAELWAQYHLEKAAEEAQLAQYAARWATPDRNCAVLKIRTWYPTYEFNPALSANYKSDSEAYAQIEPYRWFYRYASKEAMEHDPIGKH